MNKSSLKRLAVEVRAELELDDDQPLDPFALAKLYGVPVFHLSEVAGWSDAGKHFRRDAPERFSGALIPCTDGTTVILENDAHSWERRVSTASHEMAHVLLEHPFAATLTDSGRCRVMAKAHEDEAAELGAELLLPAVAACRLALRGVDDVAVARQFEISVELASWRMNATGARLRAQRARAKRRY